MHINALGRVAFLLPLLLVLALVRVAMLHVAIARISGFVFVVECDYGSGGKMQRQGHGQRRRV